MELFTKTIIPTAALHLGLVYISNQTTKLENSSQFTQKSIALREPSNDIPTITFSEHLQTPFPFFEPKNPIRSYNLWKSNTIVDPSPQWNLPNLRTFLGTQNIIYPELDSAEFDLALTTRFYPPTESLKLGFGVCDEFALLALYGLLQIPEIQQTYVGLVSGDQPLGHAFTLFEMNNYWGFTSNDEVSQPIFPTPQAALENMLTAFPFDPITSYFFLRKVDSLGPWVYDINAAEHLSPDKSITISTLDTILQTNNEF